MENRNNVCKRICAIYCPDYIHRVSTIIEDYGIKTESTTEKGTGNYIYAWSDYYRISDDDQYCDLYPMIIINKEEDLQSLISLLDKEFPMIRLFAVETCCPELFDAVVALGKKNGYRWHLHEFKKGPYVCFRSNRTMDSGSIDCITHYDVILDAATQFNEVLKQLKSLDKKTWKIGCSDLVLQYGKLECQGEDIPYSVVKEVYEEMTEQLEKK